MCRSEKSLSALCGLGTLGGGGRMMGSSAALLAARNDSKSDAVTRDADVHKGRRRMMKDVC